MIRGITAVLFAALITAVVAPAAVAGDNHHDAWRVVDKTTVSAAVGGEGVATVRLPGQPAQLRYTAGNTIPANLKAEGWGHIGDPDSRGRGVGRAAQALGLDKAFDEFGVEKVWAEVLADNEAALKAQTSCGFRREGYLRSHALKDGVFRDVVLLAILAGEWRARRTQVRKGLALSHLIAA